MTETIRIRAANRVGMSLLTDVLQPEVLHRRVPRLGEVAEARADMRNMLSDITKIGAATRQHGFTPGKEMQWVAQIDQAVWTAVLTVFEHELYPDGKLDKKFFYALLGPGGPLHRYDMRATIIV